MDVHSTGAEASRKSRRMQDVGVPEGQLSVTNELCEGDDASISWRWQQLGRGEHVA
jgi:hypothetical protein